MPSDSNNTNDQTPPSGQIFAFNKNGANAQVPSPAYADPSPAGVSAEPVIDLEAPINNPAPTASESIDPINVSAPAPTSEPEPVAPSEEKVENHDVPFTPSLAAETELTGEEIHALEGNPDPVQKTEEPVEEMPKEDELDDLQVLSDMPEDTNEPAEIDVDSKIAEANRLEQEALATKKEALGLIDKEIERINDKALKLAEEHKETLRKYREEKENLEKSHAAMVELKRKTADDLGLRETE